VAKVTDEITILIVQGVNEMSKIKLLIILSGIIMTIAGFSITAGAISYEYDDLGRLIEVIYDSGQK